MSTYRLNADPGRQSSNRRSGAPVGSVSETASRRRSANSGGPGQRRSSAACTTQLKPRVVAPASSGPSGESQTSGSSTSSAGTTFRPCGVSTVTRSAQRSSWPSRGSSAKPMNRRTITRSFWVATPPGQTLRADASSVTVRWTVVPGSTRAPGVGSWSTTHPGGQQGNRCSRTSALRPASRSAARPSATGMSPARGTVAVSRSHVATVGASQIAAATRPASVRTATSSDRGTGGRVRSRPALSTSGSTGPSFTTGL